MATFCANCSTILRGHPMTHQNAEPSTLFPSSSKCFFRPKVFALAIVAVLVVGLLIAVLTVFSIHLTVSIVPDVSGRLMTVKPSMLSSYISALRLPVPDAPTTIKTEEYLRPLHLFNIVEHGIGDISKIESFFLKMTIGGEEVESFYKVANISRNGAKKEILMTFIGSSDMLYVNQGAAFLLDASNPCSPIAIFLNPHGKPRKLVDEASITFQSDSDDSEGIRSALTKLQSSHICGQTVEASSKKEKTETARKLLPSRFGTSSGVARDVFFNTYRLYNDGVAAMYSNQFQVLLVQGRCMGTRFNCHLDH